MALVGWFSWSSPFTESISHQPHVIRYPVNAGSVSLSLMKFSIQLGNPEPYILSRKGKYICVCQQRCIPHMRRSASVVTSP
ncbi:hypothetical protein L210DRAFT_943776 [Boletus edulis BED1]|uniref:Uncharacterized protein n=1 Tax=Boletus edulis BED1 TaxID=1328754 RepID=A0AAD4BUY0_BOLED|nr:hypothetical protein L210DRAFT_943776 [Boletus edulis BED1]